MQTCQVVRFNRILSDFQCKIRMYDFSCKNKFFFFFFFFFFYWRIKIALKSAGKCYFYMLKIQKVPIVGRGKLPSHTLPPLGRLTPSDDVLRAVVFFIPMKILIFGPKY